MPNSIRPIAGALPPRGVAPLLALALGAAPASCRSHADRPGAEPPGDAGVAAAPNPDAGSVRPGESASPVARGVAPRSDGGAGAPNAASAGSAARADGGAAARRIVPMNGALQGAVCGGRRPCKVLRVRRAGDDSAGRPLYVATADLGIAPADDPEAGSPDDPAAELSFTETGDVSSPAPYGHGCHRYEFWLVAGTRPARATQLLYESCNDGYGAAGVGYDSVEVGDREVEIERSGGSNWRWSATWKLALDPVRVREVEGAGTFTGGWHEEHETWSWDAFEGRVRWSAPTCDPGGNVPDEPEEADDGEGGDRDASAPGAQEHRYLYIPQVTLDPAFERAGWRTTRLEECAAHVDSTGSRGFVTHGGAGPAEDASLAVVASQDGALFVEIHDDRWTGPTDRWVADDHVELWLAPEPLTYMSGCIPRMDDAPPKQWAIRAADGRVFAGFGHPAPADLAVERAAGDGVVRLRITVPREAAAIAVVYSDGDDGVHQKRLIATSALEFGRRASLGELKSIAADEAVCTAQGGALRPRMTRRLARASAVVGRED